MRDLAGPIEGGALELEGRILSLGTQLLALCPLAGD